MTLWDRIGQLANNVKDLGNNAATAMYAGPKFIWDVATAPWNDDEEFQGFANTFKSAGQDFVTRVTPVTSNVLGATSNVLKPFEPTLQKLDYVNRNLIREPLATAALTIGGKGNLTESYQLAQEDVSFGQAIPAAIGAITPGIQAVDELDYNDPVAVKEFFDQGANKFWSGLGDASIQIFGDVSIGVGKAAKAARASKYVTDSYVVGSTNAIKSRKAEAIKGIQEATVGTSANGWVPVENKYSAELQKFVDNGSKYAYDHPMIASSPYRSIVASGMGGAKTAEEASLLWRVALEDPLAIQAVKDKIKDTGHALDNAMGNLTAYQEYLLNRSSGVSNLVAGMPDWKTADSVTKDKFLQLLAKQPHSDQKVVNDILDEIKYLEAQNSKFVAWREMGETPGGGLTRGIGATPFNALDTFKARARSLDYNQNVKVDVWQPTPFHRMYQKVSWVNGQIPAGVVNLNDDTSSQEIIAFLDHSVRLGAMDDVMAENHLAYYLKAVTPEDRANSISIIETSAVGGIARKYGMDMDTATSWYRSYHSSREGAKASLKNHGFMVADDGSVISHPEFESQTANYLPMIDIQAMNKALKLQDIHSKNRLKYRAYKGFDDTVDKLDALQTMFKAAVLMRLGYTIRNGVEAQFRIAATNGALTSARFLGEGMKNAIFNTGDRGMRLIDRVKNPHIKASYDDLKSQVQDLNVDISKQTAIHKRLTRDYNRTVKAGQPDPTILAEIRMVESIIAEKNSAYMSISEQMGRIETKYKGAPKQKIGQGKLTYRLSDGTVVEGHGAFENPYMTDIHRRNSSSQESWGRLIDEHAGMHSSNLTTGGYGAVEPTDANYYTAWAETVTRMFGNSQPAMQLINGKTIDEVLAWMKTAEGRVFVKRMKLSPLEHREYVTRIAGYVDTHIPAGIVNKMLKKEPITAEDLRAATKGQKNLPIINGHVLEENFNLLSQKVLKNAINATFRLLGSMPEDAWARHPLYAKYYRDEWAARLKLWDANNPGAAFTADHTRRLEDVAHRVALKNMKDTLFTIDRRSNMAGLMRFIVPFFSAYENTLKTWAKIAYENPQTINRFNLLWTSPNRAGIATDAEGNPVPVEEATMDDYLWLEVPKGLKNLPWIGKGLASLDQMGVQKRSLDVMFQGEGIQLPIGPYVSMPISALVAKRPDLEKSLSWAIPFGPDRNLVQSLMPAWVKRQIVKNAGMDDQQYANTYGLIWTTEQHRRKKNGQNPATAEEIQQMTDAYWNMRTVANLILPFAPTFQSPYRFYIDQYRTYQKDYGLEAKEKFLADFGEDFFAFTQSLSKNPTGSFAAVGSVANAKEFPELVSDLSGIDSSLVSLVTNAGVEYSYSNAAYLWQQRNTLGPSTSEKFRTKQDPRDADKQNQRDLGWIKYRKIDAYIDAQLERRGLNSLNQKDARDLAQMKKQAIKAIADTNEPWYDDYLDTDGSKTNKVIRGLERIVSDEKFMTKFGDNPTFKAVVVYLNARNAIEQQLVERPVKGIDSKENRDLKIKLDNIVSILKDEDPGFADLHNRWLSYDPAYDLIHASKVNK